MPTKKKKKKKKKLGLNPVIANFDCVFIYSELLIGSTETENGIPEMAHI